MATWTNALDDADDETVKLMLQLQLDDLTALTQHPHEHASESELCDQNVAYRLYEHELRNYHETRGLGEIDDAPSETISESETWHSAAEDANDGTTSGEPTEDEILTHANMKLCECNSCLTLKTANECYQVPCQHYYCNECLDQLFSASTKDETLYPPKCCRQLIPFEDARTLLSREVMNTFGEKKEELDDTTRVYCHAPTCSAYIGVDNRVNGIATCPKCRQTTCTTCKGSSHSGNDCPADENLKAVLTTAENEGWQRCKSCGRMVELILGCNHITCPCGAEFCYLCGLHSKTCTCPQWDENRLTTRAEDIVRREGRELPEARLMVPRLRQNHNCDVHEFNKVEGEFDCDTCGQTLFLFIFRCENCHTQMCARCRFHR